MRTRCVNEGANTALEGKMTTEYNPQSIELKWQDVWQKTDLFKVSEEGGKPKYYLLEMFPTLPTHPHGAREELHHR